jgi:glucokinase
MALNFLPFGGIYIAGGIATQNIELMQEMGIKKSEEGLIDMDKLLNTLIK